MTRTVRRVVVLLATTLGLIAAAAGPAAAGFNLSNHCEPPIRPVPIR
jgi:hypothetical protein